MNPLSIISDTLGCKNPAYTDRLSDLGATDTLDLFGLCVDLEHALAIDIPDDEVRAWRTVGDVIATVERRMKEAA